MSSSSTTLTSSVEYQGFWYPPADLPAVISAQQHFQALPTDVIIAGALKTGNTWLKALCFAMATRNDYLLLDQKQQHHQQQSDKMMNPLLSKPSHFLIPFLVYQDRPNFPATKNSRQQHPLLATHNPYPALPESVISSGCKIIYICREPKDTFVSLFHFQKKLTESTLRTRTTCAGTDSAVELISDDFNLERQLDLFCEGKNWYGPYWDHVLGYHKASLDRPEKFLFLKYEQLHSDTIGFVKKLAAFMDKQFTEEEELEGVPAKIVRLCSFNSLSNTDEGKQKSTVVGDFQVDHCDFYRKGKIGDWKNELTPEMADKIDMITHEKLKGVSGFSFG